MVKNPPGFAGSIPELGRTPEGGKGYPHLENPMDRGAWWATFHGVAELDMTEQFHMRARGRCNCGWWNCASLQRICFLQHVTFISFILLNVLCCVKVYDYELCSDSAPLWALVLSTSCEEATPWLSAGLTLPCLGQRTLVEVHMGLLLFSANPGPCLLPVQKVLSTCCLPSQGQGAAGGRCPIAAVSRAPPHGRALSDKSAKRAPGSSHPGNLVCQPQWPGPWAWTKIPWDLAGDPPPEAARLDRLRPDLPESSPA